MIINDNVKNQLFDLAKEHYDSFSKKVRLYDKLENRGNISFLLSFALLIVGLVVFLIFEVLEISENYSLNIKILGLILLITIFGLFFHSVIIIFFVLRRLEKKNVYLFQNGRISFCHLYCSYTTLQKYTDSKIIDQLKTGGRLYYKYLSKTFFQHNLIFDFKEGLNKINLPLLELCHKYPNKYFWFKLEMQTQKILQSLCLIEDKLSFRIGKGMEIDLILSALKLLMLFEYATLNPKKIVKNGLAGDYSEGLLLDFVSEIDKLSFPKSDIKQKYIRISIIKLFKNGLFYNKNILITLVSWFLILLIVFGIALILAQQYFAIPMDSKILIGLVSAPFAGAIAIALNNKRDKT